MVGRMRKWGGRVKTRKSFPCLFRLVQPISRSAQTPVTTVPAVPLLRSFCNGTLQVNFVIPSEILSDFHTPSPGRGMRGTNNGNASNAENEGEVIGEEEEEKEVFFTVVFICHCC